MDIDSIYTALDRIDSDRDNIAQRRVDRMWAKVIEGKRHPHPTPSVISIIDIGTQVPNVISKPFINQGLDI